uniref:SUN domain-containing protein n=1 Tax=Neogobius melanostomus TaxID=47308 RepID=A0A8C6T7T6_9GOBI
MEVNSDLRRSPRLQQNGYYNQDARPRINYYEAPYRAPSRRGQRSATTPPAGTAPPAGRGFLTWHQFILLLCAVAVACVFSMHIPASTSSSVREEPLKMMRDESIQSSVLDESLKMTRGESIQWSVVDEPAKMMSEKSILSPKPDGLPNVPPPSQVSKILRDRSSETYARKGYMERVFNWFCPKYHWALQDSENLVPRVCWPFQGSAGKLHVQLDKPVHISHVTIGHITKDQSPTGEITTAPKLFSVYGMETSDDNETLLGRFEYDASGPAFQTFSVDSAVQGTFKDVRLNVESNWGNTEYTCLYNFKVHGTPVQPEGRV